MSKSSVEGSICFSSGNLIYIDKTTSLIDLFLSFHEENGSFGPKWRRLSAVALMNNQPLLLEWGSPGEPPFSLLATFPSYFCPGRILGPLSLRVRWWCTDTHPGSDCLLVLLSLVLTGCGGGRLGAPTKSWERCLGGYCLGLTPSVVIWF